MKKYLKPDVSFMDFGISPFVSSGCAFTANTAPNQCAQAIPGQPGLTIFQESTGCIAYGPGFEDQICYHVPLSDMNVFES